MQVIDLISDRLILKQGNFEDYKKVYEYDFRKLRNINGEFNYVKYKNDEMIRLMSTPNVNPDEYDYIIYLKESMIPIGNIMADRKNETLNSLELSFNLHPNYWKNGYMTEAILIFCDYLYQMGYDNILCGYSEGNEKSKLIGKKIGFTFYEKEENAWIKDGVEITDYKTILSKSDFYKKEKKQI